MRQTPLGFLPARLGHILQRHAKSELSFKTWRTMTNIAMALYFAMSHSGFLLWMLGFSACCALIVTSAIGALSCRRWARRQGLEASRHAWLGAFYWACGLMPWVHFAFQINGRKASRLLMMATYAVLFFAWLAGPVIAGFLHADPLSPEFLIWIPIANLLAFVAALVCLARAEALPARQQGLHIYHVIPSLLWSLAMLTLLPYLLFLY